MNPTSEETSDSTLTSNAWKRVDSWGGFFARNTSPQLWDFPSDLVPLDMLEFPGDNRDSGRQFLHIRLWSIGRAALDNKNVRNDGNRRKMIKLVLSKKRVGYLTQPSNTTTIVQGVPFARGLGWVDLNLECSTVCPILHGLMGIWQKGLGIWARWCNT